MSELPTITLHPEQTSDLLFNFIHFTDGDELSDKSIRNQAEVFSSITGVDVDELVKDFKERL